MPQELIIAPALPKACSMCPWRLELQGQPFEPNPDNPAGVDFYCAESREALWTKWGPEGQGLADGTQMFCHKTAPLDAPDRVRDGSKVHYCTGGDALQQRAFIRWCVTGVRAPLRGDRPGRWILGAMFDVDAWEIDLYRYQPHLGLTGFRWEVRRGVPLLLADVLAAAHPAVFELGIGSEQVSAPTEDETAQWHARAEANADEARAHDEQLRSLIEATGAA
jgi:hypothetical protein